jgi:hypothetical protein
MGVVFPAFSLFGEIEKMTFGFESPVRVGDTRANRWSEFEKSGH